MGRALEVITGTAVNPSSTLTAVTMNSGDSNTVRSASMESPIHLAQAWTFTTTNLTARIRSPRMHDQAQNLRLQPTASQPYPLLALGAMERLYAQDPLTIEIQGGTAETDLISALLYYEDLPGVAARLHAPQEILPLIEHITTVEVDLTTSGTSGAYSATVALNGTFDTLIRNRDYAIVGYQCSTTAGTLGIRGADTGNLRVGGPISNLAFLTDRWFLMLSEQTGLPCVPVINSGNVAAVLLDCAAAATSASLHVGVHLALLKQGSPLS